MSQVPKSTSPAWLQTAAARVDHYQRLAAFDVRGVDAPPMPDDPEEQQRRQQVADAGVGLSYSAAAADTQPSDDFQRAAFSKAAPLSFAPERHVFYVLGRPCVVLMCVQRVQLAIDASLSSPPPRVSLCNVALEPTAESLHINLAFFLHRFELYPCTHHRFWC